MFDGLLYNVTFYRSVAFVTMLIVIIAALAFAANIRRKRSSMIAGAVVIAIGVGAIVACSSLFEQRDRIVQSALQQHYVFSSYTFSGSNSATATLGDGTTKSVSVDYSRGLNNVTLGEEKAGTVVGLPISFYEK